MRIEALPGYEGVDADAAMASIRQQVTKRVRRWDHLPRWAVWLSPEAAQVVPRSELVGRLHAAALPAVARTAATLKVPAGSMLVWIEAECGDATGLAVWKVMP